MKICKWCKAEVEDKDYVEHIKKCSIDILGECPLWEGAHCHLGYIDCLKESCGL